MSQTGSKRVFLDGHYLEPLTPARPEELDTALHQERRVIPISPKRTNHGEPITQRAVPLIAPRNQLVKQEHTISPSIGKQDRQAELVETATTKYGPALAFQKFEHVPANEVGIWMHRLYQVYLHQPAMLVRAMNMPPFYLKDERQEQKLISHCDGFRTALEKWCGGIKSIRSEVPVSGLNQRGQVISGVIDLLAQDDNGGWWIIDHKTDRETLAKAYWEQLEAYSTILKNNGKVMGCALNWTRHEKLTVLLN